MNHGLTYLVRMQASPNLTNFFGLHSIFAPRSLLALSDRLLAKPHPTGRLSPSPHVTTRNVRMLEIRLPLSLVGSWPTLAVSDSDRYNSNENRDAS